MVVRIDADPDERRLGHDEVPGIKGPAGDETLSTTCGGMGKMTSLHTLSIIYMGHHFNFDIVPLCTQLHTNMHTDRHNTKILHNPDTLALPQL